MIRGLTAAFACVALLLVESRAAPTAPAAGPGAGQTEVVVELDGPALATAPGDRDAASARIDGEQHRFARRLRMAIPGATVRWRYRVVVNGLAVVLPVAELDRLGAIDGVRTVFGNASYRLSSVGPAAAVIRARSLPGLPLSTAGEGMKIGIIDTGIDQTHPFFDPGGYAMPAGYPKGQKQYTTAKVIVARAFPPPGATGKDAGKPFDPNDSGHATHVAGIAAGNANTDTGHGQEISGIAPRAYLGNYRAYTVFTDSGYGLDGNAPEVVAAIEAAVADGMNVINLSIGEPEIEPSRDVVALALDAAADAGVVPVVSAGNDFDDFGPGSLTSPGTSERAITVGAVTASTTPALASFSSAGPTPISLRLKPDVVAPGVDILSSVPGDWSSISGTSMAAPHVAGAAALLLQRHPDWSSRQVKAALTVTARPVASRSASTEAPPTRAGSGLIDVGAADRPLVLPEPTSVSLGLIRAGTSSAGTVELADAGGGAGDWTVSLTSAATPRGATLTTAPSVTVPGTLALDVATAAAAAQGDLSGVAVLTRGTDVRRIPFWGRVTAPALGGAKRVLLRRPGVYSGTTKGKASLVSVYRYPEVPAGGRVTAFLNGPEQVFRIRITRPVANFGVAILRRGKRSRVEPRVVVAGDENRLTGYAGLPVNINPYLVRVNEHSPVAGAISPRAGAYDLVFDSATAAGAGTFTFRYWVDDVSPPSARILTRSVKVGAAVQVAVADGGAGVDPTSAEVVVVGSPGTAFVRDGRVRIRSTSFARPGRYLVRLQVSDYQETRNMENVAHILPNTRVVRFQVTVTR